MFVYDDMRNRLLCHNKSRHNVKDTSEITNTRETEVVVEHFVQPDKPENLDVLFVIDTSCSMSDNFENVSAGLDILRDDIETLTYDYQIAMINSSLREIFCWSI